MTGLNPLVQGSKVLPRVYSGEKRLVRRIRQGPSYGGVTTIDVIGCNMLCSYCYVDTSFLVGRGPLLDKEKRRGSVKAYAPNELANFCFQTITQKRWPKRIQITAAEPFLTPEWLIEFIEVIGPFLRQKKSLLWIDTNGVNLVENPQLFERLKPSRDFLRLFISSKNSPDRYTAMTRAAAEHSDTAFRCLELAWNSRISSFLQAPIADLFSPESFEWYFQRLSAIHRAAPLLLDLDRLSYLPLGRIRGRLKSSGLWDKRERPVLIEEKWKTFLESRYGRKIQRLISVDQNPEDEKLVADLIFRNRPLENCRLFC